MPIAYQTSIFWLLCSILLLFSSIFLLLIVICEKAYEIWSPSYSICFSIEFTCLFWGGHGAWGQFLLFCIMNYVEITRCPRKNVRLHAKYLFINISGTYLPVDFGGMTIKLCYFFHFTLSLVLNQYDLILAEFMKTYYDLWWPGNIKIVNKTSYLNGICWSLTI